MIERVLVFGRQNRRAAALFPMWVMAALLAAGFDPAKTVISGLVVSLSWWLMLRGETKSDTTN